MSKEVGLDPAMQFPLREGSFTSRIRYLDILFTCVQKIEHIYHFRNLIIAAGVLLEKTGPKIIVYSRQLFAKMKLYFAYEEVYNISTSIANILKTYECKMCSR